MTNCIFCDILSDKLPSSIIYRDDLFGPAFEYRVDRQLTVGLNTKFGPNFTSAGGGAQFAFITQMVLAYRL